MKFGGSCLKDKNAFEKILNILNIYKSSKKILVASAFNGITDLLLKAAENLDNSTEVDKNITIIGQKHTNIMNQIFEQNSQYYSTSVDWLDERLSELDDVFGDIQEFGLEPYYKDYVLSFGERISTFILNQYLLSKGLDSEFFQANDIIITNDDFNNAYPIYELTKNRVKNRIMPLLENPKTDTILCITGFIARNKIGYITTLGRGGSDYTATILARSIHEVGNEEEVKVILWKDVDGLLAINPKYIPNAALIKHLDYDEAKEIANFGAKVLHPKCLEAIERQKIPLEIRNFDKPKEDVNFTRISPHTDKEQIKGISTIEKATIITVSSGSLVDVPGVLAEIFKVMGKNNISVSLVSQSSSEISTSFVVEKKDSEKAINALQKEEYFSEFFEFGYEDVAVMNITGTKILENKTKAMIFQALDKKDIHVKALSQSSEELNLSIVIDPADLFDAINIIHDDLCEEFNVNICKSD
ncbi:MAG: Aspartokinase [Promethearchaeota archaeon]|nr:MAG: Aspartokinase [Candidatus Lokiarchaeota archaeon]